MELERAGTRANVVCSFLRKSEWYGARLLRPKCVIFWASTVSTGVWKGAKKNSFEVLDIEQWCSKIANGSALPKSVEPCRGFTVGSEVIQGTDPIVRRLISTG
jgi:hypothetical protein